MQPFFKILTTTEPWDPDIISCYRFLFTLQIFQVKKLMIAYEERQNHLSDETMVNGVTRNTINNRNLYSETTSNTGGSDMGVVVNMDPVNPQDIYIDMNTGQEILYTHDGVPMCDDGTVLVELHDDMQHEYDDDHNQATVSMDTDNINNVSADNKNLVDQGHGQEEDLTFEAERSFQSDTTDCVKIKSEIIDEDYENISNKSKSKSVSVGSNQSSKKGKKQDLKKPIKDPDQTVKKKVKTENESRERLSTKLNDQRRLHRRRKLRSEYRKSYHKPLSPLNKLASRFKRPLRKPLLASPPPPKLSLMTSPKKSLLESPKTCSAETQTRQSTPICRPNIPNTSGSQQRQPPSQAKSTPSQNRFNVQSNVSSVRPIIRPNITPANIRIGNRVLLGNQYSGTPIQQGIQQGIRFNAARMAISNPGVRAAMMNRTATVNAAGIQAKITQQRMMAQTGQGFTAQSQQTFSTQSRQGFTAQSQQTFATTSRTGYAGQTQQSFITQSQQSYGSTGAQGYSSRVIQQNVAHTSGLIQNTVQQTVVVQQNTAGGVPPGKWPAHTLLRGDNVYKAQRYNPVVNQMAAMRGRR